MENTQGGSDSGRSEEPSSIRKKTSASLTDSTKVWQDDENKRTPYMDLKCNACVLYARTLASESGENQTRNPRSPTSCVPLSFNFGNRRKHWMFLQNKKIITVSTPLCSKRPVNFLSQKHF
eukprot:GEMP01009551.1.p1 GENE.GEMP01009551.1~~GEMP01009551.1.p1  ORF type:complete len:121 (-),score=5.77 GEMP01009551.1:343-705(-)